MLLCVIRVYKICHLEYLHRYVDVCYETLQPPPPLPLFSFPLPSLLSLPPPPTNFSILVLLSVLVLYVHVPSHPLLELVGD